MPQAIERQTAPGTRSTNHEITTYDQRPPIYRKLWGLYQQWGQVRHNRIQNIPVPVPKMPLGNKLVLQHTTQLGTGMNPTYQAVSAQGDYFTNSANAVLQFFSTTGAPFIVRIVAQSACQQGYFHDYTMEIPSNLAVPTIIGPFDYHYNDSSGFVQIHYIWGSVQGIDPGVTVALVAP